MGRCLSHLPAGPLKNAPDQACAWVDGPKTLWFGAAIGAARTYLAALVNEFPGGVELAPGLSLPKRAEHESIFGIGLPGSGKTLIIEGLAYQAIGRGDRVLCLDAKGALHKRITALAGRRDHAVIGIGRNAFVWAIGRDVRSPQAATRIQS